MTCKQIINIANFLCKSSKWSDDFFANYIYCSALYDMAEYIIDLVKDEREKGKNKSEGNVNND